MFFVFFYFDNYMYFTWRKQENKMAEREKFMIGKKSSWSHFPSGKHVREMYNPSYLLIFLIVAPKRRLWVRRGGSNLYPQSLF